MKFALKSRTVVSSLLVIAAMVLLLLSDMGYLMLGEEAKQLLQALAGASGEMSVYGRVKADGPLTMRPGASED